MKNITKSLSLLIVCLITSGLSAKHFVETKKNIEVDGKESLLFSEAPFLKILDEACIDFKNSVIIKSGKLAQEEKGGVFSLQNNSKLRISNVVFDENGSHSWSTYGGAVFVQDDATLEADNCIFNSNKAQHGAALSVMVHKSTIKLKDTVFVNNCAKSPAPGNFGGAIFLQGEVDFSFTVSEGKNIVISNNTAYSGGFIHTHNAGIRLLFDIKKGGKLVVGSVSSPENDSINLVGGALLTKEGPGVLQLNSTITRNFSDAPALLHDIIVKDGTFLFCTPLNFDGKLLLTGGKIHFNVPVSVNAFDIMPENTVSIALLENLKNAKSTIHLGVQGKLSVDVDNNNIYTLKHSDGRIFQLNDAQQKVDIGTYTLCREQNMGVFSLTIKKKKKEQ